MLDLTTTSMTRLAIHRVGNKLRSEGITIAPDLTLVTDDNITQLLLRYFLNSFKEDKTYKFYHETELELNEIFSFVTKVFKAPETLYEQSINILKHLYSKSSHPKIKAGELYISYFKSCIFEDNITDAIGIFKSENKETYLQVTQNNGKFAVGYDRGININKLDKGCLIFNLDENKGYKICIVDATNSNEAFYWVRDFLKVVILQNEQFNTDSCLAICNSFSKKVIEQNDNQKSEQVKFLNDATEYFSNNEIFNWAEFTSQVVQEPYREQFINLKDSFEKSNGIKINEEFIIPNVSKEKVKKIFKSSIKLDTDIEIIVKFNPGVNTTDFIEKGFDSQKNMSFYKVFFNREN